MFKNVASQKVAVFAWDGAAGAAKTGDAAQITAEISIDGAASAATDDTNPTELDATDHPGVYIFDMTQAETNGDLIVITPASSTTDIIFRPSIIYTEIAKTIEAYVDEIETILKGSSFRKNVALTYFDFVMKDSVDHVTPETGLTVTGQISKDGGAFAALTNAVAEIGSGCYKVSSGLTQAEMNADSIILRFTATGADATLIFIHTID